MNWYDRVVLPYLIDVACGLPMVQQQRRQIVPQAQGRVLEVGMGTGRNLPFMTVAVLLDWWAWIRPCKCTAWPKSAAVRRASMSS